jgi:hypothetical protein
VLRLDDVIQDNGHRVGRLLVYRGHRGDGVVGPLDPADAGASVVVNEEIVGQGGTHAGEIVVAHRGRHFEYRRRPPPRRVAAGVALEELRAGGGAIVGVEDAVRDEATLGVDLREVEEFDFSIGRVRCPREPADPLECQPVARGGDKSA